MGSWLLVIAFGLGWHHVTQAVYSPDNEKSLRDSLIDANYDPVSRPSIVTDVTVKLSLLSISELDLKKQQFIAAGWLTLEWTDSRLIWTPASNNDLEYFFATPASIWKPEVVVDNSLANLGVVADNNLLLRVKHDGTVEWEPPRLFTTQCSVDVSYFPYDRQRCGIEIISWGFRNTEVTLTHKATAINMDDYVEHGEWEVTSTSVTSALVSEERDGATVNFPQLDFWINLQRRSAYHGNNTILPVILSSFLILVVFVLPAESGEKASYALTVLLALAVLLALIAGSLPETSISTSVLGVYVAIVLIFSTLTVLLTVWILVLYHRESKPDPNSIFYAASRAAARVLCMAPTRADAVMPLADDKDGKTTEMIMSWQDVSKVWDRVFFIVFLVVNTLLTFSCMVALDVGGDKSTPT